MSKSEPNRWKGFVLGVVGAIPGMMAMDYYWKVIYSMKSSSTQLQSSQQQSSNIISPFGQQFKEGESSTEAMGRIIYRWVTSKEPQSEETLSLLSNLTDWGFGMLIGGVYGAFRDRSKLFDLKGELLYSTGLWLMADEIGVPLMGLSKGPMAYPLSTHLEGLGAHLVFGLVSSTTTNILDYIL